MFNTILYKRLLGNLLGRPRNVSNRIASIQRDALLVLAFPNKPLLLFLQSFPVLLSPTLQLLRDPNGKGADCWRLPSGNRVGTTWNARCIRNSITSFITPYTRYVMCIRLQKKEALLSKDGVQRATFGALMMKRSNNNTADAIKMIHSRQRHRDFRLNAASLHNQLLLRRA